MHWKLQKKDSSKRQKAYKKGRLSESFAKLLLRLKGYKILRSNFKTPVGEIDIIACKRNTMCYIEVKARETLDQAMQATAPAQRRRIEHAAIWHQKNEGFIPQNCRFDLVVCVKGRLPSHIKDAWREGD